MSTDVNGKKCAGCGAYLFPEDDVVFCPVCGAPHHRDCYNSKGQCAFESLHGTDRQYDKVQQATEKTKEEKQEQDQQKSSVYTKPQETADPITVLQFDTLGGIPEDFDLGDGVTAAEARQFVFSNSHRYVPKFAAAKYGKKASFNWLAFLIPPAWFLARKMYKLGIFILVLSVSLSILTIPFVLEFQNYMGAGPYNYNEIAKIFMENMERFEITAMITFFVATTASILLSVLCGIFGDYLYRNHALSSIKEIKKEGLDISENMRKKGGINLFAAIIGLFVVEYLPSIIFSFIM